MPTGNSTDDSDLPWPECLGIFDEESCRFFLYELGQKIVQTYPFSVGMEEVFTQIVDEYGTDGAADVISVLQELLEDESIAAGVGDDGDIWRSWRYSWRHRNDDPLNPYIPRARGRILGPPTTARIRLLKSANFIRREQKKNDHCSYHYRQRSQDLQMMEKSSEQGILVMTRAADAIGKPCNSVSSNKESPSHSNARKDSRSVKDTSKNGTESVEPVIEHESISVFPGASQQSSVLLERLPILPAKRYDPNSTHATSDSPRRSMPAPSRLRDFSFRLISPRRKSCALTQDVSNDDDASSPSYAAGLLVSDHSENAQMVHSPSKPLSPIPGSSIQKTDQTARKTPLSSRVGTTQEYRLSLPSELSTSEVDGTPCKQRALHRQARMIDGALFHPKTRKGKFIESEVRRDGSPTNLASESASKRLSPQSTQKTTTSRTSWLHNVLNRFRKQDTGKQPPKLRKRNSNLTEFSKALHDDKGIASKRQTDNTDIAIMSHKPAPPTTFGFNGVSEYTNKPLPLSPGQGGRRSLASETRRWFLDETFERDHFPSEDVVYPEDNQISSLVSATMTGPHELSPDEKRWIYSSSSSSQNIPPSPSSFATFARKNPYDNSSTPSTPELEAPSPLAFHKREVTSTEWPFRTQHQQSPKLRKDTPQISATVLPTSSKNKSAYNFPPVLTEANDRRGRRPVTPEQSIQSKFSLSPSKKPRQRSRSPVKRLLGMVKSHSTNQISLEDSCTRTSTPSSTNKKKWKELGHKVRHGFLTADLEQLDQEEMMMEYISGNDDVDAVRIITPPSRGDRPTFPVSLKSAAQNILWSELEFALIETANTFLKNELEAGRLARDSVLRLKNQWQAKNRPLVVEFYYDHTTQCQLIIANLRSVKLYSDYSHDAVMLNSVLHQWKILVRELSVKTLCMPDSVVRRWIHDCRRVLELLGAPQQCLSKFDKITALCISIINSHEKERAKPRKASGETDKYGAHRRSVSDGSQKSSQVHEAALMALRPLYSQDDPPPLPTPTSLSSSVRKLTPQERILVHNFKQNHEYKRPVHNHFQSASLPGVKQRI